MLGDVEVNTPTSQEGLGSHARVREMQAKLHCWATVDEGRCFGDLFNLVHDPGFLTVAWERVAGNTGARTAGVDRATVRYIAEQVGVEALLADVRTQLRDGSFRPSPVLERKIPKAGGKLRSLGIPTVRDRVVQAALKLVMEPIFEAGLDQVPSVPGMLVMPRSGSARSGWSRIARVVLAMLSAPRVLSRPMARLRRVAM
ncbi:hypothetical protein ACFY0A_45580, partial [Streptomyces sp. NPDC001698]